jgi:hypothetical protein
MRAVESAQRVVDSTLCIDSSVLLVSSNDKKMLPFFKISLPPPLRVDRPYPRLAQPASLSFGSVWAHNAEEVARAQFLEPRIWGYESPHLRRCREPRRPPFTPPMRTENLREMPRFMGFTHLDPAAASGVRLACGTEYDALTYCERRFERPSSSARRLHFRRRDAPEDFCGA